MSKTFRVKKLNPVIGAEIVDLDLRDKLPETTVAALRQAFLDNQVLFFRDQPITVDQHKALGRCFGSLHVHPRAPSPEGHPELLVIHADEKSKRVAGQGWHTDVSCDECPPMGSILHITEVPPDGGGDTIFASMYAAYDALSDKMQGFLSGLTAMHESAHVYRGKYYETADGKRHEQPSNEHPVVRTHPETGRQALFVNSGFTTKIVGMKREESRALLDFLFRHIQRPELQVRFGWRPDSIAFWDNRCVQHLAVWDYWPAVRHGVRVTIEGDRPFHRSGEGERKVS
jgi:taurine dioxygenase